jgi:hypothetical protein
VQTTGCPAQEPPLHASFVVQNWPSLQADPLAITVAVVVAAGEGQPPPTVTVTL